MEVGTENVNGGQRQSETFERPPSYTPRDPADVSAPLDGALRLATLAEQYILPQALTMLRRYFKPNKYRDLEIDALIQRLCPLMPSGDFGWLRPGCSESKAENAIDCGLIWAAREFETEIEALMKQLEKERSLSRSDLSQVNLLVQNINIATAHMDNLMVQMENLLSSPPLRSDIYRLDAMAPKLRYSVALLTHLTGESKLFRARRLRAALPPTRG